MASQGYLPAKVQVGYNESSLAPVFQKQGWLVSDWFYRNILGQDPTP